MSEWINVEKENISLSEDKTEIEVYFESDDFGARYINLKVKDLKPLLEEI